MVQHTALLPEGAARRSVIRSRGRRRHAIDMFTGIGGLGALLPVKPVVYVERGDFQMHLLKTRMQSGSLDVAVIHDDAHTVTQEADLLQTAEYIIAGFPCQSVSSMGKRGGLWRGGSTASSVFFCIIEVAVEFAVPRLFLENVEGLLQQRKHWSVMCVAAVMKVCEADRQQNGLPVFPLVTALHVLPLFVYTCEFPGGIVANLFGNEPGDEEPRPGGPGLLAPAHLAGV